MTSQAHKHCWSEIGVWSSVAPTCAALQEVIHCRNCPVYTSQGRTLLERPVSSALQEEWTRAVASPPIREGALTESLLIFRLGREHFATPTRFFEEVISMRAVHTIPHRTGTIIKGFVAFRGRLELCVSMASLLGVENVEEERQEFQSLDNSLGGQKIFNGGRILVISRGDDARYLFPVSSVIGTYRCPTNLLQSAVPSHHVFAYLKGIFPYQESTVGLMDTDLVFEALAKSLVAR